MNKHILGYLVVCRFKQIGIVVQENEANLSKDQMWPNNVETKHFQLNEITQCEPGKFGAVDIIDLRPQKPPISLSNIEQR